MHLRTGSEIIGSANENKTGGNRPLFLRSRSHIFACFSLTRYPNPRSGGFFFASLLLWLKRENRKQITEIKGEGMIAG